ncbi:unnamed protein product, partial [Mesorhabditis belari]|uniref:Battenin n=1 Tax=Mesorhabditis belari TaxID=2138241 RepID=A0AAF3ERA0_9BILA
MKTVVVTGFGPFGNMRPNPSMDVVKNLGKVGPLSDEVNLITEIMAVEYAEVDKKVHAYWKDYQPNLVIHVGASDRNGIQLEQQSTGDGYFIRDIANKIPSGGKAPDVEKYGTPIVSTINCKRIAVCVAEEMQKKCPSLQVESSNDAGKFLCGFSYYLSLCQDRSKALFVHVPRLDKKDKFQEKLEMEPQRWRNIVAFWIFGLCNNYAYILMLSAAEDIIERSTRGKENGLSNETALYNGTCPTERRLKHCNGRKSTGVILLADVLPAFIIMATAPFFAFRINFGIRQLLVVISQAASLLIVAYSETYAYSILGVVLASLSCGFGESTLVSYSSHFSHSTVVAWASGTGGAGVIGSFIYAALTEPHFAGLSPKNALLCMMIIPFLYATSFWLILEHPDNCVALCSPKKIRSSDGKEEKGDFTEKPQQIYQRKTTVTEKFKIIQSLFKYTIPLVVVYLAEYTINQGLTQLIVFDCSHGFSLTKNSQYRWYQVLYRFGVFISRSSMAIVKLPVFFLYLLPILQIGNAVFFYFEAVYAFLPHIIVAFVIIFIEGLYGGSAYVKTLNHIHQTVEPDVREFSLGASTTADVSGIVVASFLAIYLHNQICNMLEASF